jgi:hypothetical protein
VTDPIATYEDALDAIQRGIWDWRTLTRRLPGNDLPAVLSQLEVKSPLFQHADQLAVALTKAWEMCDFPEQALGREKWLRWFRIVGYIVNGEPAEPPEQVTLYRGGVVAERMAWTGSRLVAEWYRNRGPNGRLWTASVQAVHATPGPRNSSTKLTTPSPSAGG